MTMTTTEKAAHTPGPWTLQPDKTFSELWDLRIVGANLISPGIVFGGLGEETDANARLIVAAPDLSDALKRLVSEVRGLLGISEMLRHDVGNTNVHVLEQRVAEAEAAIAKSEGR